MHWKKYPNVTNVVTIPITIQGVKIVEPKCQVEKIIDVDDRYYY